MLQHYVSFYAYVANKKKGIPNRLTNDRCICTRYNHEHKLHIIGLPAFLFT